MTSQALSLAVASLLLGLKPSLGTETIDDFSDGAVGWSSAKAGGETDLNPSPQVADLTSGLVAYYPFDGNANDATGNGNHGFTHGAILTNDVFGKPESAYSFLTPRSYIGIDNLSSTNFDSDFTISLVARFKSFATDFPQLMESSNQFLAFSGMGPTYNQSPVNGNGYGHVQFYLDKDKTHSDSSHIGRVVSKTIFKPGDVYNIASSAESVGSFRFGKPAQVVI